MDQEEYSKLTWKKILVELVEWSEPQATAWSQDRWQRIRNNLFRDHVLEEWDVVPLVLAHHGVHEQPSGELAAKALQAISLFTRDPSPKANRVERARATIRACILDEQAKGKGGARQ